MYFTKATKGTPCACNKIKCTRRVCYIYPKLINKYFLVLVHGGTQRPFIGSNGIRIQSQKGQLQTFAYTHNRWIQIYYSNNEFHYFSFLETIKKLFYNSIKRISKLI